MIALKHKGRTLRLGADSLQVSWATWHENEDGSQQIEDLNQDQAEKLSRNLMQKKGELIRKAVVAHVGHDPSMKKAQKYLEIITEQMEGRAVNWVWWRKTCVAVYTDPISSIEDRRYYLRWHFKQFSNAELTNPDNEKE